MNLKIDIVTKFDIFNLVCKIPFNLIANYKLGLHLFFIYVLLFLLQFLISDLFFD